MNQVRQVRKIKLVVVLFTVCTVLWVLGVGTAMAMEAPFPFRYKDAETQREMLSALCLSDVLITVKDEAVYTGHEVEPAIEVKVGDETLIEGYDYVKTFKGNVNAGKATVAIAGINGVRGIAQEQFEIAPRPLQDEDVSLSRDSYYLGKGGAHPEVVVSVDEQSLEESKDYQVELKDCDKVGTGTVIVTGIGNFTGEVSTSFEIVPDNSVPVLDNHEMMLDVDRFTIADIVGRSSTEDGLYTGADIEWSVSNNSVIRLREWNEGALVDSDSKGRWVCVEAVAFGEADVVATFPNGKTDSCHVKVISPCDDPTGRTRTYEWLGDTYNLVDGSWGNEYVDAYLNNAERMMARHPEFEGFGKDLWEREIWGYWQPGLKIIWNDGDEKFHLEGTQLPHQGSSSGFDEVHMTKKPGELSANGWLLLETSKNQWQYLCQKVDGVWKVVDAREGSAGPHYGVFDGWLGVVFHSPYGLGATYSSNHQGQSRWSNLLHSGNAKGHPSTHGCVALGTYASKLYYDTFMLAGRCTRVITY